jgi:deazaflavin-dependent oxidoreductase (nitroreductase family)
VATLRLGSRVVIGAQKQRDVLRQQSLAHQVLAQPERTSENPSSTSLVNKARRTAGAAVGRDCVWPLSGLEPKDMPHGQGGDVKDDPASGSRGPTPLGLRSIPSGALRLAFRLPIYLYRLNLGQLLGHRFLLLVHRGRRSGLLRETVLEVLHYDPAARESVVLSAWGEKAHWYHNIETAPALEVRTGGERFVPEQRSLGPEENHAVISDYGRRHPLAFRVFARVFDYPLGESEAARRQVASSLRLVAFRPRDVES